MDFSQPTSSGNGEPTMTLVQSYAPASPSPSVSIPDPLADEFISSWALLILVALLIGSLWTSYHLRGRRIVFFHETVVSIFTGMFVGLVLRIVPGNAIQNMITFDYTLFFNLLLPPIILNCGYELKQSTFFKSAGTMLIFAILGTFISAVCIGILMFIFSWIGLVGTRMSLLDAFFLGATLSATDPVTILSIFKSCHVEPRLFTVIFGESMLNDAVAIVIFETLKQFKGHKVTVKNFVYIVILFFISFMLSLVIGFVFGVATALSLKHTKLRNSPRMESCFVLLMAYASYLFSNGVQASGIVSLLSCSITFKRYAYFNMSRRTQLAIKYIFQTLAQLSENFIFIYLGVSIFTDTTLVFKPLFVIFTFIVVCIARFCAVFPLSELINFFDRINGNSKEECLPRSYQIMLFWAGLRGAVGVALAAGIDSEHAQVLKATILLVVILTIIAFGGSATLVMDRVGIQTDVYEEIESDDEFDTELTYNDRLNTDCDEESGTATYLDDDYISSVSSTKQDLPPLAKNLAQSNLRPEFKATLMSIIKSKQGYFDEFEKRILKPILVEDQVKPN